jgi:hypothetical protein
VACRGLGWRLSVKRLAGDRQEGRARLQLHRRPERVRTRVSRWRPALPTKLSPSLRPLHSAERGRRGVLVGQPASARALLARGDPQADPPPAPRTACRPKWRKPCVAGVPYLAAGERQRAPLGRTFRSARRPGVPRSNSGTHRHSSWRTDFHRTGCPGQVDRPKQRPAEQMIQGVGQGTVFQFHHLRTGRWTLAHGVFPWCERMDHGCLCSFLSVSMCPGGADRRWNRMRLIVQPRGAKKSL